MLLPCTASPRGMFFYSWHSLLGCTTLQAYCKASNIENHQFSHYITKKSIRHTTQAAIWAMTILPSKGIKGISNVLSSALTFFSFGWQQRYGSLFTLMHAEYRVEICDFLKKCKFAPRVGMKSGTTKLLTIEEWGSNSGILCHTTKLLGFIFFAEHGIKGWSNCTLLCIPDVNTKFESTP